jgi:hypothetical protein
MDPGVVGTFIPIVAIVFGIGIGIVSIVMNHRQRALRMELRHKERLAAMDKGLELPPETLDPSLDPVNTRPRHLLRGLIWTFAGAAFAAMLYHVAGHDEAWIGGVPVAIGLGYLIFYVVEGRRETTAILSRDTNPPA